MRHVLSMIAFAGLLLGGCAHVEKEWPHPSTWKTGQILAESSTTLGYGYRKISRSEVNPPGHWEGVGHFGYIYHRNTRLCQCSAGEVSISPQGRFAVYVGEGGNLTLFDATNSKSTSLSDGYIGTPDEAEWDISHAKAIIHVRKYDEGGHGSVERAIPIELPPRY